MFQGLDVMKADSSLVFVCPVRSEPLQNAVRAVESRLWEKFTKVTPRVALQPGYAKIFLKSC